MPERDRITLALAIVIALLGPLASTMPWIIFPTGLLAVFLILWGRESQRTESAIGKVPNVGPFLLRGLHQLDSILSPRDEEFEQHPRKPIGSYDSKQRAKLYELWRTRNPASIANVPYWQRFNADGLVDHHSGQPGAIKNDIREALGRILKEYPEGRP